jgi:hypothetical protein
MAFKYKTPPAKPMSSEGQSDIPLNPNGMKATTGGTKSMNRNKRSMKESK